jgi:hypothetical protein
MFLRSRRHFAPATFVRRHLRTMLTYRGISVSTPDTLENAESHLESFKPFNVSQSGMQLQ